MCDDDVGHVGPRQCCTIFQTHVEFGIVQCIAANPEMMII